MKKSISYIILIARAKARNSKPGLGFEKHHIVPRCCGGSDDKDNLVVLTYQEHYNAHKILAMDNPDIPGLQWAWLIMTIRDVNYTAEEYAEARHRVAIIQGEKSRGENNNFYGADHSGENNGFYGHHHSEASRKSMSDTKRRMAKDDEQYHLALIARSALGGAASREVRSRPVQCVETGETYSCISDAEKKTGIRHVGDCCRGTRNVCGGYHWRFV